MSSSTFSRRSFLAALGGTAGVAAATAKEGLGVQLQSQ